MARTIDQIRASKLPSNMMQFAARGALQVPPAENIEILVYLALHNKVFGELARMTLAGWDEKACLAAVSDPQTNREVLDYFISPDNVRPKLLLALLENPSVPEAQIVKLASSAMRDTVEIILKSKRALALPRLVNTLSSNPYLRKEEAAQLRNKPSDPVAQPSAPAPAPAEVAPVAQPSPAASVAAAVSVPTSPFEGDHTAAAEGGVAHDGDAQGSGHGTSGSKACASVNGLSRKWRTGSTRPSTAALRSGSPWLAPIMLP